MNKGAIRAHHQAEAAHRREFFNARAELRRRNPAAIPELVKSEKERAAKSRAELLRLLGRKPAPKKADEKKK